MKSNNTITEKIKIENDKWTYFLLIMLNLSWTLIFNMSTQKDVVNDVKAESALEYAAAIKPKIKIIIIPKVPILKYSAE